MKIKIKFKVYDPTGEKINYKSYAYQKIIRALWGYKQHVKNNYKKHYVYERKGLFTDMDIEKIDNWTVIIDEKNLDQVINFFEGGVNTTHKWKVGFDKLKIDYNVERLENTEGEGNGE